MKLYAKTYISYKTYSIFSYKTYPTYALLKHTYIVSSKTVPQGGIF